MSEKSRLEERIAEAEDVLRELEERQERERERRQHAEIDRLEEHLARARVQLSDVRSAADTVWTELREGIESMLAELRRLLDDLKRRS